MGWADRVAIALAAKSSNANSAKSADSCGWEAIGTIGAFGIGGFGPADRQSDAELIETLAMVIATKPGVTVTGPEGWDYCRSEARRRLAMGDPPVLAFLAAAGLHPSSWPGASALPLEGCRCIGCGGRRWWRERKASQGWKCETCYPAANLSDTDVEGVAT